MKRLKIGIAMTASALGALMPWRTRVAYSELLGWVAQLVPPSLHRVRESADDNQAQP